MSTRFRLMLSGACALLVLLCFAAFANHVTEEAERSRSETLARYGGEVVNLVVATEQLEEGDLVTSSNVELREWLVDLAPEGALVSLDECVDLQVTAPVAEGSVLTDLAFREDGETLDIPSGCVAISVPLSDGVGLPAGASQGSRVVAYRSVGDSMELLAADVTILSRLSSSQSTISRGSVTLALDPSDTASVLAASASGDLRLVVPAPDVTSIGGADQRAPSEVTSTDPGDVDRGSDSGGLDEDGDAGSDSAEPGASTTEGGGQE